MCVSVAALYPEISLAHPVPQSFLDPEFQDFLNIDAEPAKYECDGPFIALSACVRYDVYPFCVHDIRC